MLRIATEAGSTPCSPGPESLPLRHQAQDGYEGAARWARDKSKRTVLVLIDWFLGVRPPLEIQQMGKPGRSEYFNDRCEGRQ